MTNTNLEELIGRLEAELEETGSLPFAEVSTADLRAAITRLREMEGGWRSLEDEHPPQDGTPVDLWIAGWPSRRLSDMRWVQTADDYGFRNANPEIGWMEDEEITHWRYSPSPPLSLAPTVRSE